MYLGGARPQIGGGRWGQSGCQVPVPPLPIVAQLLPAPIALPACLFWPALRQTLEFLGRDRRQSPYPAASLVRSTSCFVDLDTPFQSSNSSTAHCHSPACRLPYQVSPGAPSSPSSKSPRFHSNNTQSVGSNRWPPRAMQPDLTASTTDRVATGPLVGA